MDHEYYDLWKEVEIRLPKDKELPKEVLDLYEEKARKAFELQGLEILEDTWRKVGCMKALTDEDGNIIDIVPVINFNAKCRKKENKSGS